MTKTRDPDVKSAVRTLAVLELFDEMKCPLGAGFIKARLGLPHSSASMLLRNLVAYGYLSYDPAKRTYMSTLRLAYLGKWIEPRAYSGQSLSDLVEKIAGQTGELIAIATRLGNFAQYILVHEHSYDVPYRISQGSTFPLVRSTSGWALMTPLPDPEIARITVRSNADLAGAKEPVSPVGLVDRVSEVRHSGFAFSTGMVNPGAGAISMVFPPISGQADIALVLGGATRRLTARFDEYKAIMRESIAGFSRLGALPPAA